MKTVFKSQPGFYSALTNETNPAIPEGKMWIHTVTVETYELDAKESTDLNTEFQILAALPSSMEDKEKANIFRDALVDLGKHIKGNLHNLLQ